MKTLVRRRGPTIALAVLMFVVGGATVTTAHGLITSADIKDGAVKTVDLGNGAVKSGKIADGGVASADLAANAVGSAKINDGQVKSADIANGGVGNADLAGGAVNSGKIANGGVASADLAADAVGSAKISDGQVKSADIANGGVATADLAADAVNSAKVADGSITIADMHPTAQNAFTAYSEPNWSVMDRNVINNGDSDLRAGPSRASEIPGNPPVVPPLGVGSLGIRTGGRDNATGGPSDDKAAFGNEVDFAGGLVSELTAVSFFLYTTGENYATAPDNLPSIAIEIDPNLLSDPTDNFATMIYSPGAIPPAIWFEKDAFNDAQQRWGLSSVPAGTLCEGFTQCTFAEVRTALNDDAEGAVIGTVGITKGRDHAFSGAVDALQINDTVYDFEPNGVFETPAAP